MIVDRTDVVPPPQVTYTVGGEITVQGSVTVTGNAKASVEVPLTSVSAEVSVGIAGQTSVSVKKTVVVIWERDSLKPICYQDSNV